MSATRTAYIVLGFDEQGEVHEIAKRYSHDDAEAVINDAARTGKMLHEHFVTRQEPAPETRTFEVPVAVTIDVSIHIDGAGDPEALARFLRHQLEGLRPASVEVFVGRPVAGEVLVTGPAQDPDAVAALVRKHIEDVAGHPRAGGFTAAIHRETDDDDAGTE